MRAIGHALCVLAAALVVPIAGGVEPYPARPVRVIAPYPPGSSADVMGRIYARSLTEAFGRQFVVDNRSGRFGQYRRGAGGSRRARRLHPAGPEHVRRRQPPAAEERSFRRGARFPGDGHARHRAVPARRQQRRCRSKNVKELIALAKASAGKLVYASTGIGGGLHLTMELFRMQTGIDMLHVPYKGSSTTVPDMIGGRIDVMFGSAPSLLAHVRAGRIRALGITSAKRSAAAPDVPTIAESGVPGFESATFGAFAGPAKTPRSIVGILNAAIAKSAQSQEVASALANQGTDAAIMTPEQGRSIRPRRRSRSGRRSWRRREYGPNRTRQEKETCIWPCRPSVTPDSRDRTRWTACSCSRKLRSRTTLFSPAICAT